MSLELTQCEVAVRNDAQLIACLRQRRLVHKDSNGEFIWGQFNAKALPFYLEKSRVLPAESAKHYVLNSKTEVHVPCPNCEGKKRTVAGPCADCKGTGITHELNAGAYPVEALVILRTFDNELREVRKGIEVCPFCSAEFSSKGDLRNHLQEQCAAPEPSDEEKSKARNDAIVEAAVSKTKKAKSAS